ncbi:unnamed protein product [Adineta ricciae]|uniref:Uncharacterized protein n=1 Tax=Adineta ricciae TaxID=249248 RepID=A0A815HR40_ADIRI|nr:unnamed protein product [Adineta ricciae]CAF1355558.1 unnamed protein product [Adineta ricciae]
MRNISSYRSNRRLRKPQHLVTIIPSTSLSAKQITSTVNASIPISFVIHSKVLLLLICVPLALFVLTLILRSIRKRKQNATEFVNQRCSTYRQGLRENLETISIDDEPLMKKSTPHSTVSTSETQTVEPSIIYRQLEKSLSRSLTPQVLSTISIDASTNVHVADSQIDHQDPYQLLIERMPCILSIDHSRDSLVSKRSQLTSSAYPDTDASTINYSSLSSLGSAIRRYSRFLQPETAHPLSSTKPIDYRSSSTSSISGCIYLSEIIAREKRTPSNRSVLSTDDEESCI